MIASVVAETSVLIVGAGQAGMATSVLLRDRGIEHIVLERAQRCAAAWRNDRWDSFNLITPNTQTFCLPGTSYQGDAPWGFDGLATVIEYFDNYVSNFTVPVICDTEVTALRRDADGRFRAETSNGVYLAANVVVATGYYAVPRVPASAASLPPDVYQIHTSAYRNPSALPPGAVLVVGSANSGAQVAEELNHAERTVYLAVGNTAQVPRRYRGRDMLDWALNVRVPINPASNITGRNGGDDLGLHRLRRDGVRLTGRLKEVDGDTVWFGDDLYDNLAAQDASYQRFKDDVDAAVRNAELTAPDDVPHPDAGLRDGYSTPSTPSLSVRQAGIGTVIWGTGYGVDHRWIDLPAVDADGRLQHERGVTAVPGLYCVGMTRPVITGQVGVQAAQVTDIIGAGHAPR